MLFPAGAPGHFPPCRWRRAAALLGGLLLAAGATAAPVEVCEPASLNERFVQPASTREMIDLIGRIYAESDPLRNVFRSTDQLPLLKGLNLRGSSNVQHGINLKIQLALQYLQAGRLEEALIAYQEV